MGSSLPSKLPKLWEAIVGPLQQINTGNSFGKNHHILQCVLINEILFELGIETILMLMIFAVRLCYLSLKNSGLNGTAHVFT